MTFTFSTILDFIFESIFFSSFDIDVGLNVGDVDVNDGDGPLSLFGFTLTTCSTLGVFSSI